MYSKLSEYFSEVKDLSVAEVGEKIGGKVGLNIKNGTFQNACAIRMSYAFNKSGKLISKTDGAVSSGEDKKWYLYRVKDFINFLKSNYTDYENATDISKFKGKTGVIVFEDCGWSDATGHVDLYDGDQVEGSDYSDKAKSMTLFKIN